MEQLDKHPVLRLVIFSIAIVFVLEMMSKRSFIKGLGFIIANPLMFLFNVLIILLTMSISLVFSRKGFLMLLVSILWIGLGIANYSLLSFRTTPLTVMDFFWIKSVTGIVRIYLNKFQMTLVISIAAALVFSIIFLRKRFKKTKPQFKLSIITLCVTAVLMVGVSNLSFRVKALTNNYGNIAEAYLKYGFAYCFSNSVFDRGISKPAEYSEEIVTEVLKSIGGGPDNFEGGNNPEFRPNIIMVQLESFFDVNYLHDYKFSQNPIPNFSRLKKEYSSGFLTVPSIGAGTANTEFEILTGMNLDHFGAGEYPYKTILQKTTSESVGYNLDELGYHIHAIHNNTGTFYDRNIVFGKLGFDSFSSIEYMNDVEYTPVGWAKDSVLRTEVYKALMASSTRDFVFAISVQPHGKFPETVVDENQRIKVVLDPARRSGDVSSGADDSTDNDDEDNGIETMSISEGYKNKLEYFVNQLSETDKLIGDMVDELSDFEEPTVVVFYGDHLPSLDIEDEHLANKNKFQTEYVLWSNFKMEKTNRDLEAYQLTSYIMERLNFDNGILTKFHQRYVDKPDYQEELKLLQYDMLYGDRSVYKGENPYKEKTVKMGVLDVVISDVSEKGQVLFVAGENFTPSSVVYFGDDISSVYHIRNEVFCKLQYKI